MEVKIGQFIKAKVEFEEEDGRYKVRPCLVLDKARYPQTGEMVYLVAQLSTKTDKVRGAVEVILEESIAKAAGLDAKSVIRFSRTSLIPLLEKDVTNTLGSVKDLPKLSLVAIQKAALSVGCKL